MTEPNYYVLEGHNAYTLVVENSETKESFVQTIWKNHTSRFMPLGDTTARKFYGHKDNFREVDENEFKKYSSRNVELLDKK